MTMATPPIQEKPKRRPRAEKETPPAAPADLLDGLPKPRKKAPTRREPEGRFSLANRHIFGLPLFDPTAHEKRGMNRIIETTLARRVEDGRGGFVRQENRIEVVCAVRLGADDLDCLLALIYLAAKNGEIITADGSSTQWADIVDGLQTGDVSHDGQRLPPSSDNVFVQAQHMRFVTSWYALCREMGLAHGTTAYDLVTERMKRLRSVSYYDYGPIGGNARRIRAGATQNLVVFRGEEGAPEELVVVLNAPLSRAVLGQSFAKMPLHQYRSLTSNTARILFVRLCAVIQFNECHSTTVNRLLEWVYIDPAAKKSTHSQRKKLIREALNAIGALSGWSVRWVQPREGRCDIYRGVDPDKGRPVQAALDFGDVG